VASREYRLIVEGELSDLIRFEGMALTHEDGNTVLTGYVQDQSMLHGLLTRVSDLGLTLLAVTAIDGHRVDKALGHRLA